VIRWILARMEKSPSAVFYEKELAGRFPADFEWAKRERLLCRAQAQVDGGSYSFGQARSLTVVSDEGQIEAFDDEDPEAEPVQLTLADLVQWRLDLEALALSFQEANGLHGKPESLDDRLFFLGEAERSDCKAAYVLGLLHEPRVAQALLAALPALLPRGYGRTVVVCPSFEPTPTHRRQLQSLGVSIVPMDAENPLALSERAALEQEAMAGASPDFHHSEDFRSVSVGDREFALTPRQAEVIQILYRAHRNRTPELGWAQIRAQLSTKIDSYPERLTDIFKRSDAWKELIVSGRTRGSYRLNL
jgi:hypothetical protein